MSKNFDGVIEAVRYKNGQISLLRVYERRGATFSDRILLDRKTLLERLQKGKRYVTGSREELRASTFNIGQAVLVIKLDGRELLATSDKATREELEKVPAF